MSGCVDDVDNHVVKTDGRVLGEDGDALFLFEVTGAHNALAGVLVVTKGPGLTEHGVYQRRLSVVNVGDDGNVSNIILALHNWNTLVAIQNYESYAAIRV